MFQFPVTEISVANPNAAIAPLSVDKSPQVITLPDGNVISTVFVYESVHFQKAANSVYVHKSTVDGLAIAANPLAPKKYIFRTDYERMQYIIGKRGVARGASGYQ
jgi:hypothetical protein